MKYAAILPAMLLPATLAAHSGHGLNGGGSSLLHYLSEPEHVAALVLLVAAIAGATAWWLRQRDSKG